MEAFRKEENDFIIAWWFMAERAHQIAREHGFEDESPNKGEMIALMHSELSETLEAIRQPGPDDKLPQFKAEAVELADAVIRILHYAHRFNLPVGSAIVEKMRFNEGRPHKHGKEF